jgi:secreted PhoX family phosphatase
VSLRRFLVGPVGCEITGIAMTPDARTLFVNIQHPGEDGSIGSTVGNWPNPNRDPLAFSDGVSRPRSATLVIYRNDGGEIAL